MGFAEDKVYNHILKNMSRFCDIHVASLVDSLSCLTDADRDELHTRQEMRGIRATVYKFYQHLKCRKGWVMDLINALHQNNAGHLAEELQQVYDLYQAPPPGALAPPSASASAAWPAVSSDGALKPFSGPSSAAEAPKAEPPRSNPSAGGHPPLSPAAATTATSAVSSDVSSTELDARAPVQESHPERKSPQPPLMTNTVCDGKEKPVPYPTKELQEAVETPGASSTVLPSVSPEQGQEWLSHRHPVCVDNGCFGNANHLQRGVPNLDLGSLPPKDLSAASGPEQTRNEPQEDVYISSELPVRLVETAGGGGLQPPASLRTQEQRAVHSSKHDGPPSSFVDMRNPLLIQQQFDVEQKQIEREREGGGDVWKETATSVSTSAPRDISPFCDTSLKPPVRERTLPGEEAASSTPSMPQKEQVISASVASLSAMNAAGSFEGAAGKTPSRVSSATSIWASHDNEEEDVELSKPGALQSVVGESPKKAAARYLGSPSSNTSSHLGLSSDPLMVSADSLRPGEAQSRANSGRWSATPAVHADPGGEKAAGESPYPPLSWASPSVGTHEVHVEHHLSALLEAGNDVRDGAVPSEGSPDSNKGSNAATNSSQVKVPTSGDSNGPSLLYILPAVGIALISVFLVYTRLQK
ncbi:mitochondrial antiviral-signaling protein isoform X1 [Tympanuchus pallidicinctus]|uniref:mitochondrial antiviral-signaling protein isoform X1 n=1 Tax=Tympanuchus pallidicinctus TaxID=109042 RepID=UPI002286D12A|nr:mitochondrial antiviral-signaling protein isoform X1 [Tympanuchus pallidicinctus]XP_052538423.1 mitochondrial antiviral-signaling protein isoform X1 [Tympanuchus pallidicinctus]XP_052538424.1 mitochondrial antiviral-signaling protein isoform X1 [Tympanuchus pallidicinctus]XP_052538425.1 mitochondrial antiviral-signaling protein isoform X1 [Tympanuchus pallidicinctus]XP_052538426.1 mitochondrial antiviral-signaling protein isoform X1 [Tympanuchus pallidicinctus]XP_052538427.1 mitochondrial a